MRRFWVKKSETDEEVIGTYFDSYGKAKAVANALEQETGDEYDVTG